MARVHVPGLPHTETIKEWSTCAFTQKIRHLSDMLMMCGHEVFLYSAENNDANCTEHIIVANEGDRKRWFGEESWVDKVFDRWALDDPCWVEFNGSIISSMLTRVEPGDFLALPMGKSHEQIANAFPDVLSFESGIGYEMIMVDRHHVFESSAWMHNRYGVFGINDGLYYDTVIPNAFDPNDFYVGPKDDYLLFLGRHTSRKGLKIVEEIAKEHRVVSAGQGDERIEGAEYVGVVRGKERSDLISKAKALIAPTMYIEPFGGVVVEAQLSGVVPITTDFGAFRETIQHEVTGFRCNILQDFFDAIEKVHLFDADNLRQRAINNYSLDVISLQYDAYLNRLNTRFSDGWFERRPE